MFSWTQHVKKATMGLSTLFASLLVVNRTLLDPRMAPLEYGKWSALLSIRMRCPKRLKKFHFIRTERSEDYDTAVNWL